MLNLSSTQRSTNYYLKEIDIVKSDLNAQLNDTDDINNISIPLINANTTINTNSITTLQNNVTNIQANEHFPSTIVKPFNADCIMYLDFSDPLDIGRDCTGYNNHAINQGVEYKSDATRTHTAYFDVKDTLQADLYATNISVLSLTDKIDKFKPSAYSYSFKFKQNTAVIMSDSQTLLGYGVNSGDPAVIQDGLTIYTNNNELNIEYRSGGLNLIELVTPYTPNAFNHVVVVNDSA
jgi:hypothetical protein